MNNLPPLAPLPRNQRNVDDDHLNLLSIFYFVTAALAFLSIPFLVGHYELMHFMFTNPAMWKNQPQRLPPEFIGMLKWLYIVIGFFMVTAGTMNLMSGLFMRRRKHRTFSLVIAAINCLQIPLGTTLGVFTIIVLIRPSVVEIYETVERGGR